VVLAFAAGRADLERRIVSALAAFHAREPLRPGLPRGALAGALPENVAGRRRLRRCKARRRRPRRRRARRHPRRVAPRHPRR
jgi:hypothetical protein